MALSFSPSNTVGFVLAGLGAAALLLSPLWAFLAVVFDGRRHKVLGGLAATAAQALAAGVLFLLAWLVGRIG